LIVPIAHAHLPANAQSVRLDSAKAQAFVRTLQRPKAFVSSMVCSVLTLSRLGASLHKARPTTGDALALAKPCGLDHKCPANTPKTCSKSSENSATE
jgi:hypothetical protein